MLKQRSNRKIKRCIIYTRVSTDQQAEVEFNSCEAQEQKMKYYIKSQDNLSYVKTYHDEGFSGSTLERPKVQELLRDAEQGIFDTILVYKLDRLTRMPRDFYNMFYYLEQFNINFISITEHFDTSTPMGRMHLNMMLGLTRYERDVTSERVRDKFLELARRGIWKGGTVPFGYKKRKKRLLPHPKESEIVKDIFDTYIETGSLSETYHKLKKDKVVNRKGNTFTRQGVFNILRNVVYMGKVKHRDVIYDGVHKAIVSETIFNLAQGIHKEKVKKHRVYRHHLFGGFIYCTCCGYSMTPVFTNKKSKGKVKRYFYYRCLSTLKRDWDSCETKQISADKLENFL